MNFEVYINNVLLKNNPSGLDDIQFNFVRDNSIFGLYVTSSVNLIFVGDGYSIIKDFVEKTNDCELDVKIYTTCNKTKRIIIDGYLQRGDIKLNYANKTIESEIIDKTPLANISSISDVSFDYNNTKDIYGNEIITPNYISIDMFDEYGAYSYTNIAMINLESLMKNILSFMTGIGVGNITFISDFFSTINTMQHYRIQFSFAPTATQLTEVRFKDFYNRERYFLDNLGGPIHLPLLESSLQETGLGNPAGSVPNIRNGLRIFDYNGFYYTVLDTSTNRIDAYSNVPIKDLVITTSSLSSPSPTVTVTKMADVIDYVNYPCFLNYRMMKDTSGLPEKYDFVITFKELMTELNKLCNVFFVVSYNNSNRDSITFRLEDENFYLSKPPTISIDDVKDLSAEFISDGIFGGIDVGSSQSQNSKNNAQLNFTSLFCGINESFDAKSDYVIDTVQIFSDLAEVVNEDDQKDSIYIIQTDGSQAIDYPLSSGTNDFHTYNAQLNNSLTLYRHLSKFNNNLNSSGKSVDNTSLYRLFTKYTFKKSISIDYFYDLIDNLDIRIQFKQSDMSQYKNGIIKDINYNFNTGEALFTVLGE